jgi:hypothetical protein
MQKRRSSRPTTAEKGKGIKVGSVVKQLIVVNSHLFLREVVLRTEGSDGEVQTLRTKKTKHRVYDETAEVDELELGRDFVHSRQFNSTGYMKRTSQSISYYV